MGNTIAYQFVATNTGNVTLSDVCIDDTQTTPAGTLATGPTCESLASPSGGCSGSSTTLAPGQSATFVATYTLTQAGLDNGSVNDSATASGTPPLTSTVTSTPSLATVDTAQTPALTVTKTSTTASYSTLGQVIPYTITATNTGNVTLSNVSVADANATVGLCSPTIPDATLAVGASITCAASHTVTQADLDAASITNVATARAPRRAARPSPAPARRWSSPRSRPRPSAIDKTSRRRAPTTRWATPSPTSSWPPTPATSR